MNRRPIGLAPGAQIDAAGQDARKYSSRNPVVRSLIDRWLDGVRRAAGTVAGVVVDIGTGEGIALERLGYADVRVIGIDFRHDKLLAAKTRLPGAHLVRADAGMLPLPDRAADVTMCIEVLEHLIEPGLAVDELARVTRGLCVVSVPWEPYFRTGNLLRGKNVARLGNDPEHVQRFGPRRLRRLLASRFGHVDIQRSFPWIVAVARP